MNRPLLIAFALLLTLLGLARPAAAQQPNNFLFISNGTVDPIFGTPVGGMTARRKGHTATLLPTGKVLISGGGGGGAELYDPATLRFTATGTPLVNGRKGGTATLLPSGLVLVVGGDAGASAELYDPVAGTWRPAGSNPTHPFNGHTATLLPSGKVLVVGGISNSYAMKAAELYDPATETWEVKADLNVSRYAHTATLLPNGKVLVAGGSSETDAFIPEIASAELYDPAGNGGVGTWTVTASLVAGRDHHTATLLPNGKVLVTGGFGLSPEFLDFLLGRYRDAGFGINSSTAWDIFAVLLNGFVEDKLGSFGVSGPLRLSGSGDPELELEYRNYILSSCELYDPSTETWSSAPSMGIRRYGHTTTVLPNGTVLAAGGDSGDFYHPAEYAETYNPNTNSWGPGIPDINYGWGATATLLPNGTVLFAGGTQDNYPGASQQAWRRDAWLYNPPGTATWASTPALATARQQHTATLLPNGKVLVAGGTNSSGYPAGTELYDPVAATWSATTGSLDYGRFLHTATLLPTGRVLVAGGYSTIGGTSGALVTARTYSPSANGWFPTGSLATARFGHTATLLANGKVLVTGGFGSAYLTSSEIYDPATGTWAPTGNLGTARAYHTATLLTDGKVLVAGGYNTSSNPNTLASSELYDPATGTWTATTGTMVIGHRNHTATLLPDGKVLVVAGENETYGSLPVLEVYNPATQTWLYHAELSSGRRRPGVALLPDGRVLIAGGLRNDNTYVAETVLYDPGSQLLIAAGNLGTGRSGASATVLLSGKVLLAGGSNGSSSSSTLTSAELFTSGLGYSEASRPVITTATFTSTGQLALLGTGFKGISGGAAGGSGGNSQDSSTNYPVVQLRWLEGGQSFLQRGANASSAAFFSLTGVSTRKGYAVATVFANGIPSSAKLITPNVPGAPTGVTATAGIASATVVFTPPASDGGLNITGYTVTSSPGGVTATGTASPLTVTGLTNGTAYTFTVTATNAVGTSAPSAPSNSVTPFAPTVPGAPIIGTATGGNASASVTFTPPVNNGGSPIIDYTVAVSGAFATGTSSPITVTGLTNNVGYTFVVTARNAVGTGAPSANSNIVIPTPSAPNPPTNVIATGGNASASVSFTPGALSGLPIQYFYVTASPGGQTSVTTGSSTTVSGLTNGTAYTFTVSAVDTANNPSVPSAPSNSVTPAPVGPGAPTIGMAIAGTASASVNFTPPASNGGAPITSYTATSSPGGFTGSGAASPVTVLGLTNGTAYTFTVRATNVAGSGAASAASNAVTPVQGGPNTFVDVSSLPTARRGHTATLLPNGKTLVVGGINGSNFFATAYLFDPATGTWTATGSLTQARYGHTATLLTNGKVLVVGGASAASNLASAEIYDPNTGLWTATGSLTTARVLHTATLLTNSKVLVVGGWDQNAAYFATAQLYNPGTGTWENTGSLAAGRNGHTATLLPDGKVLVAGGDSTGFQTGLASAELYDPVSQVWTTTGSLGTGRLFHTATLLANGKVLVAGGIANNLPLVSAQTYDPATQTWTSTTGNLVTARWRHSATLLPNGKVLLAGGQNVASAELYDPATGTCTVSSNLVGGSREAHTATLLPNGKVLLAAGIDGGGVSATTQLYDPATGAWTVAGSPLKGRTLHVATLLPNGQVLVAGGDETAKTGELYDPVTDVWTPTGSLATARYAATATLLPSGKVLVVGGVIGSSYFASAELYDPGVGTWTATGNPTIPRAFHTATLLPNGKVLVAGGYTGSAYLTSAELYDPATGVWTTVGNLATARYRHVATLLPNGKVLVAGGVGNSGNIASAELYDPASGTWTATGNLGTSRQSQTAILLPNGKVLVAGGYGGAGTSLTSAELYDPATQAWTATGSMGFARSDHTATLLPNGKVLVVGGYYSNVNELMPESELYDPATGKWFALGSVFSARYNHSATLLPNGKVLVVGGGGFLKSGAELYDVGLGATESSKPVITSATINYATGHVEVYGTGFRGISGGSGGNTQDSPTNTPVVQLRWLDAGQSSILSREPGVIATDGIFYSVPDANMRKGRALVTVFANGIPSNAVMVVSPTAPGAPTNIVATGGDRSASVAFTPPQSDGGAAVTYTVTASPGNLTATGTASPITISGLTNGTAYTFTVRATNSEGNATSVASNSVAPVAPDIAVAQAGNALSDGGSVSFGTIPAGSSSAVFTFTITNPGTAALSSLALTEAGPNAPSFTVSALSATSIGVGSGTATFTVTFSPTTPGTKTALLRISSNIVGTKNPFDITLTGTSIVPTVTGVFPASGPITGGTSVTITGTNLTGATAVTIGGAAATTFNVVNATTITATTPSGSAGLASVIVTTPIGSNTANTFFTYFDPIVPASYTSATDVPIPPVNGYTATGRTVNFTLGYAPTTGTTLTVVKNTSLGFISGTFDNLAQGQAVALNFNGTTYNFVANYYGGTGNDLVLQWADTRAMAWGYNNAGQLGNGSVANRNAPAAVLTSGVLAGKTIIAVAAGRSHSLALCADGTLAAWGYNSNGQLGNGNNTPSNVPVAVPQASGALAGKTVIAIAAGYVHSMALCSDGTVAAWGYNGYGQLGNSSNGDSNVPVAVLQSSGVLVGKTVVAIAAGLFDSLALCSDGTMVGWGGNDYGELGNGSTTASNVPVAVTQSSGVLAGKTVIAIAAGQHHTVVQCLDGTLAAWGYNGEGELGNGNLNSSNVPVAVQQSSGLLAGKTVVAIAAGSYHSLAQCSDGTLAAWGNNGDGALGDGTTANSNVPVAVQQSSGVLASKPINSISAGDSYSLALCTDGTLGAWGRNFEGQLGNGSNTAISVPVAVSTTTLAAGERFIKANSGVYAAHTLALVAAPAPMPEIAIEQPAGTELTGGSAAISFDTTAVGVEAPSLTFVIRNSGNLPLTGLTITKDGTHAADFSVGSLGSTTVAPNGSTTFTVTFTPTAFGSRSAAIHVASNDADENPFDIDLAGTGTASEIDLEQPAGTGLTDGSGTIAFGVMAAGSSTSAKTFTIKNLGNTNLTSIAITKDGANAGDYTVSTDGMTTTVAPNASTTFTITFTPAAAVVTGTRTAALHIASNDADENPFDVSLSGTGLSPTYDTDTDGLNDAAEFQLATLGFDWQTPQPGLVSTLASSANTANLFSQTQVDASRQAGRDDVTAAPNTYSLYTQSQFQALSVGVPLLQKNGTTGQFKLTIGVEKSSDLMHFDAFHLVPGQTTINAQGKLEFQFTVPDGAAFFRLQSQ